jgi:hypothetical protein
MARPSTVDDRGETLVELLITLVIMSTAVIALVTGIGAAIKLSDLHRKQATAGAYVRDFADTVETYVTGSPTVATGYTPCQTSTIAAMIATYQAVYTVPDANYKRSVSGLAFWNGTTFASTCPAGGDLGLQQVSLTVASIDGRASEMLDIVIREPCRSVTDFPQDPKC